MKLLQKKHWDALYKMAEKKWHWIVPVKVDYIYCFLEFNSNGDIELEQSFQDNTNRTCFRKNDGGGTWYDVYTTQELTNLQWGLLKVGYDEFIKYKDNYK